MHREKMETSAETSSAEGEFEAVEATCDVPHLQGCYECKGTG